MTWKWRLQAYSGISEVIPTVLVDVVRRFTTYLMTHTGKTAPRVGREPFKQVQFPFAVVPFVFSHLVRTAPHQRLTVEISAWTETA